MRTWLSIYLKGVFMGAADSVPGVSGGTIALITGIYERLVDAIAGVDIGFVSALARVHTAEGRADLATQLRELDLPFLLVLGAGIATAVVTVTRAMLYGIENYPAATYAFFFGLIAASAVVLYDHVSLATPGRLAAGVLGFGLAFLVSSETAGSVSHAPLVLFVAGAIAVCAMILPGISGAFLLLLLGQYDYMSEALKGFVDGLLGLLRGGSLDAVLEPGAAVVTFVAGAAVGLLTVSHAVSWALDNYRAATLTFLVSLMVGALRYPAEKIVANAAGAGALNWALVAAVAVIGGAAVVLVDHFTDDLEYEAAEPRPVAGRAD